MPHDAMLEKRAYAESLNGRNTGFHDGEVYQYVKLLNPDVQERNRTMIMKFEGIYMNAMVYVNGQLAAKCPYGYTGFYVPLNDYLKYGEENELRVIVRNSAMTNSRWYSGGGIYRDVYLLTAGETFIEPEGVRVMTEHLYSESAVVKIGTALKNRSSCYKELRLVTEILDQNGRIVASDKIPITLFEGEQRSITSRVVVNEPSLWSAEAPYLYSVYSKLYENNELLDENMETFGIRTLSVDPKHGFRVNGKMVKFRGACIHHDSGILGAATFYDAEYRRVRMLKEAGFNAVRMSHHPMAPVLLRACDELGMYVMDEAFDMWQRCKSDHDYGLFFDEYWENDVEAMVRKDFNHPCVVMYSIGNEIPEIGTDHGAKMCHDISEKIKESDPIRYTLASINGIFAASDVIQGIVAELLNEQEAAGETSGDVNNFMAVMDANTDKIVVHNEITKRLDKACAYTDIAGYNYMTARYELDGRIRPNRVIVGSETYPPAIAKNWELVESLDHVIGDFTWTGWDYLGEAGIGVPAYQFGEGGFGAAFPCMLAYCGDIDITGHRRPASYYREIVFGLRQTPYIAVQNPYQYGKTIMKTPWIMSDTLSSWTYPGMEGKTVVVEVYASGDQVELLVNGKRVGKKESGKAAGYITTFETIYEPGKLEAVAYQGGKELSRTSILTAEPDAKLHLEVESGIEKELIFVNISNRDQNGTVHTRKEMSLSCKIEGHADVWFGSGNPKPERSYLDHVTRTWNGKALLVLRKRKKDSVNISVGSETEKVEVVV